MIIEPKTNDKRKCLMWLLGHVSYKGDDCLIWPFGRDDKGYPQVPIGGGQVRKAHRLMCEMAHGAPPTPKHQASHSCGNGHMACINQRHLSWKTNSENQLDRRRHGTHRGSIGSRTRLTTEQIAEIRALKGIESRISIAARMGIKRGCVQYWQTHDRPPAPPGSSRPTLWRRARKAASSPHSSA